MKKVLVVIAALLLLIVISILLVNPGTSPLRGEDKNLILYWQKRGLNEKEARYLAQEGQIRTQTPATAAAFAEGNPPIEEIGTDLIASSLRQAGRGASSGLIDSCQEPDCKKGTIKRKTIEVASSEVFLEDNVSVVLVGFYCFGNPLRLGEPLFTELYLSEGEWAPRYILQPLAKTGIEITSYGKRDLNNMKKEFISLCR